ncbi:unnamed protein product [Victoria cruziana]
MLIGLELLLNLIATKNIRRIWAFSAVLLLSIVMVVSTKLAIQQINGSSIYKYLWSWSITSDFSLEFGYLIDLLTSIMSILITTVGIMVLIYSDNYLSHDRGYLRFFAYMSFFNTVMLGLVNTRLLPLFIAIPYIMNIISLIGIIMVLLGATLALTQIDIKRSLAYSTMSQLGYIMLALGIGSYRAALFNLITHAYSKALLFSGSGSIIHSMEPIVLYSPTKSQNMVLMGGILSLCGILPLTCFWSKDEILNDSWLYSPIFAIIAFYTTGLTVFYMFRMYLLTFKGNLHSNFQNYNGHTNSSFYSISIWGQEGSKPVSSNLLLTTKNNNDKSSFSNCSFSNTYKIVGYVRTMLSSFSTHFLNKDSHTLLYPHESDNTMLFPLLILAIFTLFVGCIGIYFGHEVMEVDILSKWLTPSMKLFHENSTDEDWGVRGLAQLAHSFDRRVIDGVTNGIGIASFFLGEGIRYIGGGRISSYLFLYLACVSIALVIYYYYFF